MPESPPHTHSSSHGSKSGTRVPRASSHATKSGHRLAPKTRPRLVAIDLDGTLLSSRKTITPKTHTAIKAALAAGIHIVLATARPPRSVRTYYEALHLVAPTINYNGALIWDEVRRRVVQHVPLDVATARKVITFGRKLHPELLVSVEILDKWYTDHYADIPEYMTETAKQFTPDFIGPLDAFLRVPITKLMLLGLPARILDIERGIADRFANVVSQTRSDAHMLQLMSPKTSKALALAKIAASLDIPAAEVMAIGDAPNDVDMLQWAGLAIVPENAWPEAQKVAHARVPSNDHDGVAAALRKFVL